MTACTKAHLLAKRLHCPCHELAKFGAGPAAQKIHRALAERLKIKRAHS